MEVKKQTNLRFLGVDILHFDMRTVQAYDKDDPPQIKINNNPFYRFADDDKQILFIVNEIDIALEEFFSIRLVAMGNFELGDDLSKEHLSNYIQVNAPAIMFPYIRSFISLVTLNSGRMIPTITLPPMIFQGEIKEYKDKNTKA